MEKKCPVTLTGMAKALYKKYNIHVDIHKSYLVYTTDNEFKVDYSFYIENICYCYDLTWNSLKGKVLYYLNKE